VVEPEFETDEVLEVREERRGTYRKLVVRDGRLAGALLVGDTAAAAALVRLYDRGEPLPANRLDVLASGEAGTGVSASSDPEVCNCNHVSTSALEEAIKGGCDNLARLSSATRAGTGCGSCRGQLAALILKHAPVTSNGKGKANADGN
jgi:nitrite reductase (NADH) large subunit